MTIRELIPPLRIEATLSQIISEIPGEIVDVKVELHSELPMLIMTIEFMYTQFYSARYIFVNTTWQLQSITMDASQYKKQNARDIEITLTMLRAMEGALQCSNSSQDA